MTILVSGITGFVGKHLASITQCVGLNDKQGPIDLRDAPRVAAGVRALKFDGVVHLAAQSSVPGSFRDPRGTFSVNFEGTYNLLAALRDIGFDGAFLYVGSADCYGLVDEQFMPIVESMPLRPRNPYAVSKAAAEALCYQWSQTEGMRVILARPFNHIGPGQDPRFAIADFARQITEARFRRREAVLFAGDIDVTRDFTDVRDVVRAYVGLLCEGKNGEIYNVCSGREYSLRGLIDTMCEIAGIQVTTIQEPSRFRPAEQRRMCGSYARLHQDTGWVPVRTIEESLAAMLDYWDKTVNG